MKRKFSKAMYVRVADLTNSIFNDSVKEIMKFEGDETDQDLVDTILDLKYAQRSEVLDEDLLELRENKKRIDDLYLKKLLSLSESQLQEIMICHNEDKIRRATKTVEAILSELAARSIFGDSTESESKYNDGGVYDTVKKSRKHRKQTKSTRRRTNKA